MLFVVCESYKMAKYLFDRTLDVTHMEFLKEYQPIKKFSSIPLRIYFSKFVTVFISENDFERTKKEMRVHNNAYAIWWHKYEDILDSVKLKSEHFRRI